MRNPKALGLALVAVFALSAMVTSMASAHTPATFTTNGTTITAAPVTGDETNKFTVTGQEITCTTKYTAESGTTTIQAAVHYSNCKTGLGTAATVTNFATEVSEIGQVGKCWYDISASGTAALECNQAEVTVHAATCQVHIPAQHFPTGVTFENKAGTPDDVTVKFAINGITANHTDGFLCPFGSSGHNATGVLEGQVTAQGKIGAVPVDLTWDATKP